MSYLENYKNNSVVLYLQKQLGLQFELQYSITYN